MQGILSLVYPEGAGRGEVESLSSKNRVKPTAPQFPPPTGCGCAKTQTISISRSGVGMAKMKQGQAKEMEN